MRKKFPNHSARKAISLGLLGCVFLNSYPARAESDESGVPRYKACEKVKILQRGEFEKMQKEKPKELKDGLDCGALAVEPPLKDLAFFDGFKDAVEGENPLLNREGALEYLTLLARSGVKMMDARLKELETLKKCHENRSSSPQCEQAIANQKALLTQAMPELRKHLLLSGARPTMGQMPKGVDARINQEMKKLDVGPDANIFGFNQSSEKGIRQNNILLVANEAEIQAAKAEAGKEAQEDPKRDWNQFHREEYLNKLYSTPLAPFLGAPEQARRSPDGALSVAWSDKQMIEALDKAISATKKQQVDAANLVEHPTLEHNPWNLERLYQHTWNKKPDLIDFAGNDLLAEAVLKDNPKYCGIAMAALKERGNRNFRIMASSFAAQFLLGGALGASSKAAELSRAAKLVKSGELSGLGKVASSAAAREAAANAALLGVGAASTANAIVENIHEEEATKAAAESGLVKGADVDAAAKNMKSSVLWGVGLNLPAAPMAFRLGRDLATFGKGGKSLQEVEALLKAAKKKGMISKEDADLATRKLMYAMVGRRANQAPEAEKAGIQVIESVLAGLEKQGVGSFKKMDELESLIKAEQESLKAAKLAKNTKGVAASQKKLAALQQELLEQAETKKRFVALFSKNIGGNPATAPLKAELFGQELNIQNVSNWKSAEAEAGFGKVFAKLSERVDSEVAGKSPQDAQKVMEKMRADFKDPAKREAFINKVLTEDFPSIRQEDRGQMIACILGNGAKGAAKASLELGDGIVKTVSISADGLTEIIETQLKTGAVLARAVCAPALN